MMNENLENDENEENNLQDLKTDQEDKDDLEAYLEEIKSLETDFSDLEDINIEELREIQAAIEKVRESEEMAVEDVTIDEQTEFTEYQGENIDPLIEKEIQMDKDSLIADFSDLDEIDFDELREMQEAIETVKKEEMDAISDENEDVAPVQEVSSELEERIKQELKERREEKEKEIITPEKFVEYAKTRRDKIWYHALYYLVYAAEDYVASKQLLYEMLKENTSKSAVDPIQENQFYFGLGYILRLTLNEKQIVRYMRGGKFKINVSIEGLRQILEDIGHPIITKPIIEEEEKKKMFKDFLEDDFLDI